EAPGRPRRLQEDLQGVAMPPLKTIRKRITSVKKTQQITKAMKMVAAAKLRRAQDAITRTRPYADRLQGMLGSVAGRVSGEAHPLFEDRGTNRVELLVFSSDRGLCGGFNSNLLRAVDRWRIANSDKQITLNLVGRKAGEYFKRRGGVIRRATT